MGMSQGFWSLLTWQFRDRDLFWDGEWKRDPKEKVVGDLQRSGIKRSRIESPGNERMFVDSWVSSSFGHENVYPPWNSQQKLWNSMDRTWHFLLGWPTFGGYVGFRECNNFDILREHHETQTHVCILSCHHLVAIHYVISMYTTRV